MALLNGGAAALATCSEEEGFRGFFVLLPKPEPQAA